MRQSILDVVTARFDPPATHYRRIEAQLEKIADLNSTLSIWWTKARQ